MRIFVVSLIYIELNKLLKGKTIFLKIPGPFKIDHKKTHYIKFKLFSSRYQGFRMTFKKSGNFNIYFVFPGTLLKLKTEELVKKKVMLSHIKSFASPEKFCFVIKWFWFHGLDIVVLLCNYFQCI